MQLSTGGKQRSYYRNVEWLWASIPAVAGSAVGVNFIIGAGLPPPAVDK